MTDSDEQKSAVLIKEETDDEESNLMSLEKLDRESPELWPEKCMLHPNLNLLRNFQLYILSFFDPVKGTDVSTPGVDFSPPAWTKGLTQDDINSMYQLGALSTNGIIAEIKKLYDQAYQLGMQEANEMTRGKYLNIFTSRKK
ncbi:protein lin-52 homolog isoform X1 [Toxorhynchites rutilus septentrionalis]|uniref:protein lin-52 homolog isoform X1 n=1 Tax=Toxorhynchites rutilus septentrionalis TaxID=329112 RepID=UPI00247B1591|nr:protein lin-52 homolog isoform X1 [Toxorhynchites rutilus septentrionalis]